MQVSPSDNERVKNILLSFGVKRAGMFGSQARHETHSGSDLDLLIELQDSASLFDVIKLKHALEDALHMTVDLVEYNALKQTIRRDVLHDEIRLL